MELNSTNRPVGDYVNRGRGGVTPLRTENPKKDHNWENVGRKFERWARLLEV